MLLSHEKQFGNINGIDYYLVFCPTSTKNIAVINNKYAVC